LTERTLGEGKYRVIHQTIYCRTTGVRGFRKGGKTLWRGKGKRGNLRKGGLPRTGQNVLEEKKAQNEKTTYVVLGPEKKKRGGEGMV